MKSEKKYVLEVIDCTVEDAIEAEKGGANRLEVISRFDLGGLTPSLDLVREIKSKVSLPLRVMLRESESYAVKSETEIEKLCSVARELNEIGVDGIVLGFLHDGEIDIELTKRVLSYAPKLKATFHHAFEETKDKFTSIAELKNIAQIDRILSHGGGANWKDKHMLLESYAQTANPEIEIIVGGGVDAETIKLLREKTSVREFHTGSAARVNGEVKAARVASLVEAIKAT